MKSSWFKNVEEDVQDELRGAFVASHPVRKQLTKMLEEKISNHFLAQQNRNNYRDANWAYSQADAMGYCRALNEVISLISNNKDEIMETRGRGRPKKEESFPNPL